MKNSREDNAPRQGASTILYGLLAILLGGYFISQTIRSVILTTEKLSIFEEAKQEVNELRLKNVDLILESEKVISEEYIETEARDRLNYAKDGETVFIIPEEVLSNTDLIEYVASFKPGYKPAVNKEESTTDVWIDFFREGI